jgi:transposase-like protein
LWLKRSWGGEVRNVSLLVTIGVNDEGFREILAVAEGSKEDKASWTTFLRHLREHGLREVRRITRAVGAFPDGKSALMLAAARLRHVAGTKWGTRRHRDMNGLAEASETA